MMKKITRIAALLAATAFLLAGFPACSDEDDDGDPTLDKIEIGIDESMKIVYTVGDEPDTETGITVTAKYSDGSTKTVTDKATIVAKSGDADFSTATAGEYEVTFTATYEGKTVSDTRTITVKAKDPNSGTEQGDGDDNGDEKDPNKPGNDDNQENPGDDQSEEKGTTYAWNFAAADLPTYLPLTDKKLDIAATYESTPAGLTLTFPENLQINELNPTTTVNNKATDIAEKASAGAIQAIPYTDAEGNVGEAMNVEVQGPFTATMLYMTNSSNDVTDRRAYIKIGGEEIAKSERIPLKGAELSYTYDGTDKVKVSFGATNYIRIYDIKITTKNGDGTGKTAGEVKSTAEFKPQSESVANDMETLGLEGDKAESSDNEVATAEIKDGNVVITSAKKPGSATITVTKTDTADGAATIAVNVKPDGSITRGAVTKYVDPNKVVAQAKWTVTVENKEGVVKGDDGLKVAFVAKDGTNKSGNATDFKFDGGTAALTITTPKLAASKTITIKTTGKTGSTNKESDITLTATNATATETNVAENKITFPSDGNDATGTFVYTVTEQDTVTLVFKRVLGNTSRVSKLEITVGDSDDTATEE